MQLRNLDRNILAVIEKSDATHIATGTAGAAGGLWATVVGFAQSVQPVAALVVTLLSGIAAVYAIRAQMRKGRARKRCAHCNSCDKFTPAED